VDLPTVAVLVVCGVNLLLVPRSIRRMREGDEVARAMDIAGSTAA
jgi:hypothetical protein